MDQWLEFARGPLFRFSLLFMILGLVRHLSLTVIAIVKSVRNAGDKNIPYKKLFIDTIGWIIPFKNLKQRVLFSITSVIFHIGLIVTPVFLLAHNELWRRSLGFGLPSIKQSFADILTLTTITAICLLIISRAVNKYSRAISRFQDYFLPTVLSIPFTTGYLASHIGFNPLSYQATMLIHVMSSNLIFILIPLTKLSHIFLLPTTQFVAEVGWHFPADSGRNVAIALKKEDEPI